MKRKTVKYQKEANGKGIKKKKKQPKPRGIRVGKTGSTKYFKFF